MKAHFFPSIARGKGFVSRLSGLYEVRRGGFFYNLLKNKGKMICEIFMEYVAPASAPPGRPGGG
ncbi:hypothetical protein, partial [uncultured Desulfovibrio sp.]|uniref:hypothetical protein n=1 Tax=uncultured Desulfovibrio sp. TaxID=167968 RepID=UPI00263B292B